LTSTLAQNAPGLFAMIAVLGAFGAVFRLWLRGLDTLISALSSDVEKTRAAHERCEEKHALLEQRFNALVRDIASSSQAVAQRLGPVVGEPMLHDMQTDALRPLRSEQ